MVCTTEAARLQMTLDTASTVQGEGFSGDDAIVDVEQPQNQCDSVGPDEHTQASLDRLAKYLSGEVWGRP